MENSADKVVNEDLQYAILFYEDGEMTLEEIREEFGIWFQEKVKKEFPYSLMCTYWDRRFRSRQELIDGVMESGMDPNYEILKNGKRTGEQVADLIVF